MPSQFDNELLTAALVGYEIRLKQINERISDLRRRLGTPGPTATPADNKPRISAAGRARIAAAQRARWAARKAKTAKSAAPATPKQVLSPEGRARIVAAIKGRWARARKAKAAAVAVARKAGPAKPVAKAKPVKVKKATKKAALKRSTPETIAVYIAALADVAKVSTITRRLAAVSKAHQAAGLESPCSKRHAAVAGVLRGIQKVKGVRQAAKEPLLTAETRRLIPVPA